MRKPTASNFKHAGHKARKEGERAMARREARGNKPKPVRMGDAMPEGPITAASMGKGRIGQMIDKMRSR